MRLPPGRMVLATATLAKDLWQSQRIASQVVRPSSPRNRSNRLWRCRPSPGARFKKTGTVSVQHQGYRVRTARCVVDLNLLIPSDHGIETS